MNQEHGCYAQFTGLLSLEPCLRIQRRPEPPRPYASAGRRTRPGCARVRPRLIAAYPEAVPRARGPRRRATGGACERGLRARS